ncbi:MAG TPA: DUF1173 family protein, partial [Acidiferrobacterales bacterium]|nr:DUF1173 family protein [Acidiferrobacterales bacterium]
QRRREKFALLHSPEDDAQFKMALVLGEFKAADASPYGHKVWVKHMPDCPLFIDAKAWGRIERSFSPLFEARDADTGPKLRLVLCALIYAKREHIYQIDTASLMLTTGNWIPLEGPHEVGLIQALTEHERRFLKPLRYDAKSVAGFPNALLLDTGDTPVPLHVLSLLMDAKERAAKEKAIGAPGKGVWVWHTDQSMPALPLPTRA